MATIKAAIIGCGRKRGPNATDVTGSAMSHAHVQGYQALPGVKVAGCADLVEERAKDFAKLFGIKGVYTDYREMIKKVKPDIVSISTWPATHRMIVEECAELGVRAIHCEKPMATTMGDARAMKEACEKKNVQLTFNHQRRFEKQYQLARKLVNEGEIGTLRRIETCCPNLYDWGTHWFDMMNFYNNDVPAEWLLGQIHVDTPSEVFGVRMENSGLAHIRFINGVYGLMVAGSGHTIWAEHRILGSDGIIEVEDRKVRIRTRGDKTMRTVEVPEEKQVGGWSPITWGIRDAIHCMENGREPELSARKALRATEFIFGTYESSRRRGRVTFPLDIDDNPLHTMLDAGIVGSA